MRYASLHVVDARGRVASGGNGGLVVLAQLPGTRGLARLLAGSPLARRAVARIYWLVARNRHRLAGLVPDVPAVRRDPAG